MSPSQHFNVRNDGETDAIESVPDAYRPRDILNKQLTAGAPDREALADIEMSAASELAVGQKRDDPYLVCFDPVYDAEK